MHEGFGAVVVMHEGLLQATLVWWVVTCHGAEDHMCGAPICVWDLSLGTNVTAMTEPCPYTEGYSMSLAHLFPYFTITWSLVSHSLTHYHICPQRPL